MEKIDTQKQVGKQFSNTSTQTDIFTNANPIYEQVDGLQNIYPSLRMFINTADHTHLEINIKSPFSTRHQHQLLLVIKFHQQLEVSYNNDDFKTENRKQIECILKSGSTDLFNLILQCEVLLEQFDRQFIEERQIEQKEIILQIPKILKAQDEQVPIKQEKQHNLQDLQDLVVRQNQEEQYDFQIKPMPSLSSQKQSSNETSRFKSDFDLLQRIGAGTFGQVFAARNRLDGNIYAIKRILLDYTNDKYCQKTINEAILLSRIYHPNIVRYYQSWTENVDANDEQNHYENEDSSEYEDEEEEEEEEDEYIYEDPELGVDVDFVDPDPFAEDSYDENDIQIDWAGDKNQYESDEKITPIITPQRVREVKQKQYLFIQMEYCVGETIKDKIDAGSLNSEQKKNVIRQILEALNYLHTKKYIHRDLKPQNIFLDGNLNVKLGDFGLATEIKAEIQHEKLQLSRAQSVSEGTDSAYMTQGCGTFMYLAPEQQHSRYYDAKADMFSLGIIIFEIYYRFKTDMEKNKILSNLKEGRFPDDFDSRVGLEDTDLREKIKNLINQNPQKRPDSKQLLSDYSDKQFQNMIRSLANPNHSNYQALIQALFDCGSLGQLLPFQEQLFQKALNKRPEIFFSDYQKTLNLFKDRIEYIFKMRGGIQLDVSHIIPIQKHKYFTLAGQTIEYTIQKDNQLITQDGSLVSYSDNMIMPAIHEIKRIPFKNFRRYSFGQIQHSLRSQSQQKEKCAQFDIINEYTSDLPMLELINIGIEVVKQFNSYSNFELRISHGQFVELILKELGYDVSLFIRLQTSQIYSKIILFLNTKSEQAKNLIYQNLQADFGIPADKITKFLNFLALKVDYTDKKGFVEIIRGFFNSQLDALNQVLKSIEIISNYLSLLNIPLKIYFDTFQNNDLRHYFSGIKFEIVELYFENSVLGDAKIFSETKLQNKVIQHKQSYIIGGDYSFYLQNRYGCGVSIYYDRIHFNKYNKYLSQNSEKVFKPLAVQQNLPPISHQEVDLVITHENCQFQALQLALECWEYKLSTIILKDKDFIQKQMFRKRLFEMIISVQIQDRKSSDPCPTPQGTPNLRYKVKIVFLDQKSAEQEFDDIFLKKIKKIRTILNEEGPYQEVKKFFR